MKRLSTLLMAFAVVSFLTACGVQGGGAPLSAAPASSQTAVPVATQFPLATDSASPTVTQAAPTIAKALAPLPTAGPSPTPTRAAAAATFDDPFEYCRAVGTIDTPDGRYAGPVLPEVVLQGLRQVFGPGFTGTGTSWRCVDGKLLACAVGANLPCGKADNNQRATPAMVKWCQENPNGIIPASVTGHAILFAWDCMDGTPAIARQVAHADARGFVSEFWHEIADASGNSGGDLNQIVPR